MRTVVLAIACGLLCIATCPLAAQSEESTNAQPKRSEYTLEQAEEFLRGKPVFIAPVGGAPPGAGDKPHTCIFAHVNYGPFMNSMMSRLDSNLNRDSRIERLKKKAFRKPVCIFTYNMPNLISDLRLSESSGNSELDQHFLDAVAALSPGDTLPPTLGGQLEFEITLKCGVPAKTNKGKSSASNTTGGVITGKVVNFKKLAPTPAANQGEKLSP
jgi:hypothetical protein